MKTSFSKLLPAALAALVLASFAMAPFADAAGGRGGGRGSGGGGGARASAQAGGGARQNAQVSNSRADVRTNNVRNTSVNNVNIERNVNVSGGCCNNGWDNDYHPIARAAAVGATVAVTAAVVGSIVSAPPPGCVPVNYAGMVYQQCGSAWYAPQGSQFVVVDPPY